jgi:hypothetical protein
MREAQHDGQQWSLCPLLNPVSSLRPHKCNMSVKTGNVDVSDMLDLLGLPHGSPRYASIRYGGFTAEEDYDSTVPLAKVHRASDGQKPPPSEC